MDAAELEKIRARAEAATPGPWGFTPAPNSKFITSIYSDALGGPDKGDLAFANIGEWGQQNSDAEFIAHARQDIPALIAEVERLRELFMATRGRGHWLTQKEYARAQSAEAREERLEGALRPFAKAADIYGAAIAGWEVRGDTETERRFSAGEEMVLVPREPTGAMIAAGEHAWMNRNLADPKSEPLSDCYRAMVSAALSAEPLQQSDQGGGTPARYPEGTTLAEALDAADLLAGYPDDDEADGPLGRLFITLRHEIRALSPSGSPCRNGEATRSDAPAGARSAPVQPTSSNPDTGGAK